MWRKREIQKIMTKNEALQKALDALSPTPPDCCGCQTEWQIAIDAIKTALKAPQRTWVGLTDEDELDWDGGDLKSLVKAIETKLRSKND